MKKLLSIVLVFTLFGNISKAQDVPNGDFENWINHPGTPSFETPEFWNTTDSISLAATFGLTHSAEKVATSVHNGIFALKLTGWNSPLGTAPGAASNGDIDIISLSIVKGTPDTVRHAKLNGHYRFLPVGGDTCYIMAALMKWNPATSMRDTIGYGEYSASTATSGTNYSPFTINFAYNSWTLFPDTMLILATTSPLAIGSAHAGTVLFIDNLSFTGVVGIDEIASNINSVQVYPSPASSLMTIRVDLKKSTPLVYSIYNLQGKHILSDVLEPYETHVDVSQFPAGNYTLRLKEGTQTAYSTNFMISR